MSAFFIHFFTFAETYAVLLVWITIPLLFYGSYLYLKNHVGLFQHSAKEVPVPQEEKDHGPH